MGRYRRPPSGFILCLCAAAAAGGCGKGTTPVTGTVTYQGNPVMTGNVTVIASDKTSYAGMIQPGGRFTIDRVPVGPCRIGVTSVTLTRPAGGKGGKFGGSGIAAKTSIPDPPEPRDPASKAADVPQKYVDPVSSGLTGEIRPGVPLTIDLP